MAAKRGQIMRWVFYETGGFKSLIDSLEYDFFAGPKMSQIANSTFFYHDISLISNCTINSV